MKKSIFIFAFFFFAIFSCQVSGEKVENTTLISDDEKIIGKWVLDSIEPPKEVIISNLLINSVFTNGEGIEFISSKFDMSVTFVKPEQMLLTQIIEINVKIISNGTTNSLSISNTNSESKIFVLKPSEKIFIVYDDNGLTNTNTVMNYIFINDNKLRVYPKDEYISNINGISNMIFNRD